MTCLLLGVNFTLVHVIQTPLHLLDKYNMVYKFINRKLLRQFIK